MENTVPYILEESESIELVPVSTLKPHEQIRKLRAWTLLVRMFGAGMFTTPILVDKTSGAILDGHHRWWVSKRLGLLRIPCYRVDYINDASVVCEPWDKERSVSKEEVLAAIARGDIFPPKTTRHRYVLPYKTEIAFTELKRQI